MADGVGLAGTASIVKENEELDMKIRLLLKISAYASLILLCLGCTPEEIPDYEGSFDLSVMSFNVRYDEPSDDKNQWNNRKSAIIKLLNNTKPNVFGIQEGLQHQVDYIDKNLSEYAYVGVGRDDGIMAGEYSALFYSKARFSLIESGNFWLSETPDVPSLGWDANNIRIVTWAKLNDTSTGNLFYIFNTHFDHKGRVAQKKSSELLVEKISEINSDNAPVLILGDFNMLVGSSRLRPITSQYDSAQKTAKISDNNRSYNGFGIWLLSRNIDFIFYKDLTPLHYKTVVGDYGVRFVSDHYPIIGHFDF